MEQVKTLHGRHPPRFESVGVNGVVEPLVDVVAQCRTEHDGRRQWQVPDQQENRRSECNNQR